jgi:hypothetical protein
MCWATQQAIDLHLDCSWLLWPFDSYCIYICKEQQPFSLIYIGTHTQSQEPYIQRCLRNYSIVPRSPRQYVVVIRCITPRQLVIYQHWLTVDRSNTSHSSILLYHTPGWF